MTKERLTPRDTEEYLRREAILKLKDFKSVLKSSKWPTLVEVAEHIRELGVEAENFNLDASGLFHKQAVVGLIVGPTGSGKNFAEGAILDYLGYPANSHRWEQTEDLRHFLKKIDKRITDPFDNKDLFGVKGEHEYEWRDAVDYGGTHLVVLPGLTSIIIWGNDGEIEFSSVEREFGSDSIHKFTYGLSPFDNLDWDYIDVASCIGLVASSTITHLLVRKRAAIQFVKDDIDALTKASRIQDNFEESGINSLSELGYFAEGGSMTQLKATFEGIRNNALNLVIAGYLNEDNVPQYSLEIIKNGYRSSNDRHIVRIKEITPKAELEKARDLARYISEKPSSYLVYDIVIANALISPQIAMHEHNLQIGRFGAKSINSHIPIGKPHIGQVFLNDPDINKWKPRKTSRILSRYGLDNLLIFG